MVEIIGVRFKSGGKQYYFDPAGLEVQPGQGVIVETSRGLEYGECAQGNTQVEEETVVQPLRPLVRIATEEDEKTVEKNREKEAKAFQICQEKIAQHGLDTGHKRKHRGDGADKAAGGLGGVIGLDQQNRGERTDARDGKRCDKQRHAIHCLRSLLLSRTDPGPQQ